MMIASARAMPAIVSGAVLRTFRRSLRLCLELAGAEPLNPSEIVIAQQEDGITGEEEADLAPPSGS